MSQILLDEDFDERAQALRLTNLIVTQDGTQIFERHYDAQMRRNQYSVSKSFTSAAVGIAVREGLLSLEERLTEAFSDEIPSNASENLERATVRDLLTMCLGQEKGYLMGEQRPFLKEKDWVSYALRLPFTDRPGEKFVYNNVGPYLAGVLIQRRCGCSLVDYLMPRLFTPLGIALPTWESDPLGRTFGAGGLFLCAFEVALFGQLCLQEGMWNGRQLIPAEYLRQATQKQAENGAEGYGYLFWRGAYHSCRADGKYGQFAVMLPEKNAVITANAECREQDRLLALLLDRIVPQLPSSR